MTAHFPHRLLVQLGLHTQVRGHGSCSNLIRFTRSMDFYNSKAPTVLRGTRPGFHPLFLAWLRLSTHDDTNDQGLLTFYGRTQNMSPRQYLLPCDAWTCQLRAKYMVKHSAKRSSHDLDFIKHCSSPRNYNVLKSENRISYIEYIQYYTIIINYIHRIT